MGGLVPCIVVSTLYVLLTCVLCEALRRVVEATVPIGLAKTALLEAIAGAELCGCGFELIISEYQKHYLLVVVSQWRYILSKLCN